MAGSWMVLACCGPKPGGVHRGFLKWGTPKSSMFMGFSIIKQPLWDTPMLGNHHGLGWLGMAHKNAISISLRGFILPTGRPGMTGMTGMGVDEQLVASLA